MSAFLKAYVYFSWDITLMSAYPISGAQMSAFLKGIYA